MKKILSILFLMMSTISVNASQKEMLSYKETSVHDPSIVVDGDTYYVFGSHAAAAKSKNLKDWEYFVDNTISNHTLFGNTRENLSEVFIWAGNKDASDIGGMGIWAPDVYYNEDFVNKDHSKGAYLMYFSLSTGKDDGINEHYRSLIGLASSQNIEGPYMYEDTVIYTGFKNKEGLSHYQKTDFNQVFPNASPRKEYFNADGSYNFNLYPNAIDPAIVESHDERLYMVYGSWNAGIWILELDKESGLPLRSSEYQPEILNQDPYFGQQISGGHWTSGEGPYIRYHEKTGYYHLYVTYGGLLQNDTYNVRFFRSKNIEGPYEDISGKNPIFYSHGDNAKIGNRLLGSFEFLESQAVDPNASFYGYRVPGHNSVLYGEQDYIIFHTRFKDKGEGHQVRVHQLFFNEQGWPLIAPLRYSDEKILKDVKDIQGTYLIVRQQQDNSKLSKESLGITLEEDGSIKGQQNGSWRFEEGLLTIKLGPAEYQGYILEQASTINAWEKDYVFTLIGSKGRTYGDSVLGIKVANNSAQSLLKKATEDLQMPREKGIVANIKLPTQTYGGIKISWSSSNNKVLSSTGKVSTQDKPVQLTMKASLTYGEYVEEKSFKVDVVSNTGEVYRRNIFVKMIMFCVVLFIFLMLYLKKGR